MTIKSGPCALARLVLIGLDRIRLDCGIGWRRLQVFGDLDRVGLGGNLDVLAAKAECCYEQVRWGVRRVCPRLPASPPASLPVCLRACLHACLGSCVPLRLSLFKVARRRPIE